MHELSRRDLTTYEWQDTAWTGRQLPGAVIYELHVGTFTPAHGPAAIPWLLLAADSSQGDGVLAGVDYIQRLETRGGLAPAGACDPAADATVAVPYRARYVFYAA